MVVLGRGFPTSTQFLQRGRTAEAAPAQPPNFGAIGTQLQGTDTSMNVPAPADIAVGNVLRVSAFINEDNTVTAMPSGWSNAADSPVVAPSGAGVSHRLYVMWKRAEAGDVGASTFNFTLSASTYRNAACERYENVVASGDPWNVTRSAADEPSLNDTPDVAETTTVDNTLLCWSATNWSGGTWTPPSGFTERRDSGDGVCTSADKEQVTAGSTGTIVGTCTGADKRCAWVGALVGVSAEGGTVELAGSINAASQHSGAASLALPLAGGSNAASALTGLTGLSLPAAGKADAASTLTGNVRLVVAAAGHVDAASGTTTTANVGYSLAGSVNGSSLHTGATGVSYALDGDVNAASQHSGTLSVAISLQGTVTAASDLDALLSLLLPLGGSSNTAVGMTGLLSTPVALEGNVNAAALLTGDVEVTAFEFLDGSINASMLLTGDVTRSLGLQGTVPVASLLTGGAGVGVGLSGSMLASLVLTGGATTTKQLEGSINSAFVLVEIVIRSIHIYGVYGLDRHWGVATELRGRTTTSRGVGVRWSASEAVDHRHSVSEPVGHWSAGELRRS